MIVAQIIYSKEREKKIILNEGNLYWTGIFYAMCGGIDNCKVNGICVIDVFRKCGEKCEMLTYALT